MRKVFNLLLVALLVIGFAVSCSPESSHNGLGKSASDIQNEINKMNPSDAKEITPEQKKAVENIFKDAQVTLESLASMFSGNKKATGTQSGSITLTVSSPITINSGVITDLAVRIDLASEDPSISCKKDGSPYELTEADLGALGDAILEDIANFKAQMVFANCTVAMDGVTTNLSGTLAIDKGRISIGSPATFSVVSGANSIEGRATGSANLVVDNSKGTVVSVSGVNASISLSGSTVQGKISGTFVLKNGNLSVYIEDEEDFMLRNLSCDELSVEAKMGEIETKVSVKGVSLDMQNDAISIKSAEVYGLVPSQLEVLLGISDVSISGLETESPTIAITGLASLCTPSGYVAVKVNMNRLGLNGVVDINGAPVRLESFFAAIGGLFPEL